MNLPLCDKPYACLNAACETAYHAATRINDRSADGQGGVAQVMISGGIIGTDNGNGQRLNLTPSFNAQAQAPGNLMVLAIGERGRDFTPICFNDRPSPSTARAFHSSTRVGDEVIVAGGWILGEDETFQACSPAAPGSNIGSCDMATCVGYRCYSGTLDPGRFYESNTWYTLSALLQPSATSERVVSVNGYGRLARGRFGHSANTTRGGAVVLSGGSQKATIPRETEYYLRRLKPNPCEIEQLASDGAE